MRCITVVSLGEVGTWCDGNSQVGEGGCDKLCCITDASLGEIVAWCEGNLPVRKGGCDKLSYITAVSLGVGKQFASRQRWL